MAARSTPGGIVIAGWLLKARRDVWDVVGAMAQGEPFDSWRLAPSYRVEMMTAGDPVVLWLTGARTDRPPPGLYAVGVVSGEIDHHAGEGDGWIDLEARDQLRPRCPLDMVVLDEPLLRSELRAHRDFADAEILVAPRVGNPGVLRHGELDLVGALLDGASPAVDQMLSRWS